MRILFLLIIIYIFSFNKFLISLTNTKQINSDLYNEFIENKKKALQPFHFFNDFTVALCIAIQEKAEVDPFIQIFHISENGKTLDNKVIQHINNFIEIFSNSKIGCILKEQAITWSIIRFLYILHLTGKADTTRYDVIFGKFSCFTAKERIILINHYLKNDYLSLYEAKPYGQITGAFINSYFAKILFNTIDQKN